MAPQLRIPISAAVDKFEEEMNKAGQVTRSVTRQITQQFVNANKEILASTSATVAGVSREWALLQARSTATSLAFKVGWVAAGYVVFQAIKSLVSASIDQLQELVKLSDRAAQAGVGADFFQTFTAGARNAKVSVETLEDALKNANEASKDVLNPNWTVWDEGLKKITAVEETMVDMRELFTTDQSFTGVQLFRDATNTEQRVKAVLVYMTELEAIGKNLASLELAEKMFGKKFADNIRQGNTSARELLDTMEKLAAGGAGIWTKELVDAAKAVDTELKKANDTLQRELKPQWEGLVGVVNDIKSLWADVVNLLARAVSLINQLNQFDPIAMADRARGSTLTAAERAATQRYMQQNPDANLLQLQAGIALIPQDAVGNVPADQRTPLPRRRPSDAPGAPKAREVAESASAFDTQTQAIQRNIAALEADAAAVQLTNAQHVQLRGEMRLLEAARQSDVEITQEQLTLYAQLRTTMGAEQALKAAGITLNEKYAATFLAVSNTLLLTQQNLDKTRDKWQGLNDTARFAGNQLVDVIDRATQKGAKFGEIMSDVLRSISRELIRAAITGEGAFAKMLGLGASSSGGTGGILGALVKGLGLGGSTGPVMMTGIAGGMQVPTFQSGGTIPPGTLAYVGEHGPNPRLIRAGAEPIMVTPNDVAGGSGGAVSMGGMYFSIDARGAQPGVSTEIIARLRAEMPQIAVSAVAQAQRYGALRAR